VFWGPFSRDFQRRSGILSSGSGLPSDLGLAVKLQGRYLSAQRIAVDVEDLGSFGQVSVVVLQDFPDESFFEFADGILKENIVFNELIDEGIELVLHQTTPILQVLLLR
jgi:hypothetical protein